MPTNDRNDPNAHFNPFYIPAEARMGQVYAVLENPAAVQEQRQLRRVPVHQPVQAVFQPVQAVCESEPDFKIEAGG